MRSLQTLIVGLAALVLPASAQAQLSEIISAAPEGISVTVYPDDLAMITERRTIELPAGRSRIAFEGVNDRIIPQTALLAGFGAISVERNFDYDLLDRTALFESAIGEEVTLIRTLDGSGEVQAERATIISRGAETVFRIGDRIESYQCSGLAERVVFDGQPDKLLARPTLSLTIETEEAGPQTIEFRYLASGFKWAADYILSLQSRTRADLNAWLTMSNQTGISLIGADLSVVAGTLSRLDETEAPLIGSDARIGQCFLKGDTGWQYSDSGPFYNEGRVLDRIVVTASRIAPAAIAGEANIASREDLGDYKLYRAPFATNLEARQTKQVAFLDAPSIRYKKVYAFDFIDFIDFRRGHFVYDYENADETVLNAHARYIIDNSRRGRLAAPLPEGTVRVMDKRDNGTPVFIGSDTIENLAIEAAVEIDAHFTSAVTAQTRIGEQTAIGDPRRPEAVEWPVEYVFQSNSDERATIIIELLLEPNEDIRAASIDLVQSGTRTKWQFTLRPGRHRSLDFVFRSRRR